jgi:Protein of unknown function (DUF1643)
MGSGSQRTLLAVLSNPPLTDGERTLRRVRLAAQLLGFKEAEVANLFAFPSHSTGAITTLGATPEGWTAARAPLQTSLDACNGVLLAYGLTPPTGLAKHHFQEQVEWLRISLAARALLTWRVGNGPRHPSRWQRWTCRANPELSFPDALRVSLVRDEWGRPLDD